MSYPSIGQVARYGGAGTPATRLTRVGRAEAAYNLAAMRRAGLRSPMVWLDVEYGGVPWSANVAANNAVINGVIAGYRAGGVRAGIYSYLSAWRALTGGRSLPGMPTWVPVGQRPLGVAAATCALRSYSGTMPWLTQWGNSVRDYDLTCPGIVGKPATGSVLWPYLHTVLAFGSRGGVVALLQRHLGGLVPDGAFGPLTRARVVAFQRSRHLPANGIVTSLVWRALGAGAGRYVPGRASLMPVLFART
jgi:Putative peptidoglycan binding domain